VGNNAGLMKTSPENELLIKGAPLCLFFLFNFIFYITIVLGGGTLKYFNCSYNISNISYLNSPPPLLSGILPPPIPRKASTGISFTFTYMCIHYSLNPLTCSALLFSNFIEEKA
jgi:hypothetical protein